MKRFYLFALAAMLFAACATDDTQDLRPMDAPETLTVGFEGGDDDTRVQLNEAGKTVWTKGDLVSVFYRSDANQQWQYTGETGERVGNLKQVSAGSATETMKRVVIVYPYNENYYINTETYNVEATLPATQHYLADSYGLDGNIMISSGEYNQFSLKNVCGWLKLQLTGSGEKVQSISLRGNNDEQVAGQIYINSSDATSTLAAEMGTTDDTENSAGGNLVFEDTILTEVTLDCGEGVTLGAEATAFYIALPPQTFEKGVTVEITTTEGKIMGQYTDKEIVIERNTIQPMTELSFEEKIAANQIHYTSSDDTVVTPYKTDVFGANIVSNVCENGKGIITFDNKVTSIGNNAFHHCTSLTSVTIGNGVTEIGEMAFRACSSLTRVTIPDSITEIGRYAFSDCTSLTSVTIPDSVTSIGNSAFNYCTSLTSVTIPNSVTKIGSGAFSSCSSLTAFYGKFASEDNRCLIINGTLNSFAPAGITSYSIPDSITEIRSYAFYGCHSLTRVTIGNGVTEIGGFAFFDCTSLTTITIPDSVTKIGSSAFSDCPSLTAFYGKFVSGDNRCLIIDGVLNVFAPAGVTSYAIPDSITSIENNAFRNCTSLKSVTIPDSVTTIRSYAFYCCTSLTSIAIPDSVTSIGEYAFYSCKSLTSVTIGNCVTKIGERAFYYCTSLKEVYCKPTTPPTGGSSMFSYYGNNSYVPIGCKIYVPASDDDSIINAYKAKQYWSKYADYIFEEGESAPATNEIWYTATEKVVPYKSGGFGANIVSNEWYETTGKGVITFDGEVTSIGAGAFAHCYALESINIPNSVIRIDQEAFVSSGLKAINIPDSVTSIGGYAFRDCTSLTRVDITDLSAWCKISFADDLANPLHYGAKLYINNTEATNITIPSDITEIKEYTFSCYSSLTGITIHDSVTMIGERAFCACSSLKTFYGKFASEDNRCLIVNGVLNSFAIGCGATSYTIPDSVTSIGRSAFLGCTSLTSVTIGNGVTSIGKSAFERCTSLTNITIPNSVTSIGEGAFSYCTSLKEVYCKPTTPPTGDWDMFYNNASGRRIFVPASDDDSIINAYKAKSVWSNYASSIFEYDFSAEQ